VTYDLSEGENLLVRRDDGALDEELVLALGSRGGVLLHRLEED
jgi:hypothetical protein